MSIKLATNIFIGVLALLPFGLGFTILTHNGLYFAAAVIIAVETVMLSILFTVGKKYFKK